MIRKKYDEIGLEYPEVVDKFLKEYGMLNINPRDKCYFDVSFNAIKAIGCNLDGSYFKECLAEYDINETVYPIGEACRKNLLVLMTLTESFYCFTDSRKRLVCVCRKPESDTQTGNSLCMGCRGRIIYA